MKDRDRDLEKVLIVNNNSLQDMINIETSLDNSSESVNKHYLDPTPMAAQS